MGLDCMDLLALQKVGAVITWVFILFYNKTCII